MIVGAHCMMQSHPECREKYCGCSCHSARPASPAPELMPERWRWSENVHVVYSESWGELRLRAIVDETDGVIAWLSENMEKEAAFIIAARNAALTTAPRKEVENG